MSLSRIALRIAAVEAIKGRTLVGQNVLDSPNGALDIAGDGTLRTDEDRPFVSIFTDTGVCETVAGRSLVENGRCVLVIEAGISSAMTVTNEKGESEIVGVAVPASDETFEFFLDIVRRQVLDALNDPDSEWADLFRSLHTRVTKIEVGGRRNTDDGQRLAGHQTMVTLDLVDDPVFGEPLNADAPLARFLDRLEASEDDLHRAHAATMRLLVGGSDPDWKLLQRRHGLTRAELLALGRGPIPQDIPRETPILREGEGEVRRA